MANTDSRQEHTPGPWHIGGGSREVEQTAGIYAADSVYVAAPHGPSGTWGEVRGEHEANARLIAAAPDLLATCKNLVSTVEQLIPEPSARGVADLVLFQASAAIAKAEGGAA